MRFLTEHPSARWIAPLAAAVLVAGGSVVASRATADPTLPPRTAEQLLVDLQKSEPTPMSGTVVESSNLGLPELPQSGGSGPNGSAEFGSLLSGTHTLRLWYDGPQRARVALIDTASESDLIRNDRNLWLWSSAQKKAVHHTLPAEARHAPTTEELPGPSGLPVTPEQVAAEVLKRLDPTTTVTTDGTATVAGRDAYELVLEPKAGDSLVRDVRIAIDAERSIPLRVQVHSTRLADPAFEVGFTEVSFTTPEARMFEFTPPPGTEVTEGARPDPSALPVPDWGHRGTATPPRTVGSGWGTVVITHLPESAQNSPWTQVARSLPRVSGDWGSGRLVTGTLFSAVLTDDGRLAVGLVAPRTLYSALSRS